MFGRYELPAWRRGLGLILVVVFIWGFYGYMSTNHLPRGNGGNSTTWQEGESMPPEYGVPFESSAP